MDWAVYQGANGKYGTNNKFAIIQAGGTQGGTLYDQWTYASQVKAAQANGLKVHTYLWYGVGGSADIGRQALDYFLPKILTPKGSIVALDYEDGASSSMAANTDAILYGMRRIAQAGYTPMYYSYKPYTLAHVDYQRILAEFPNSLWIAAYPDYQIRALPDYGVFPSMPGIALYQFTSMHAAGGLDGNVDLLGVTDNGYSQQPVAPSKPATPSQPSTSTAASDTDYAQTGVFKPSATVNIRTGAGTGYASVGSYAPGESVIYDHVYIRGTYVWARYLSYSGRYHYVALGVNGGESYGSRSSGYTSPVSHTYYTVRSGDSFWSIASKYGISMYTLAANNGKSIYSLIYPGESLYIR
ncbi:LysM peptidoglycan-binding domain-containing protein [Lactobacillus sp. DS1_6]|nr:LysM peptidoglycan-binding domain-containing protein [Lacticaseibacillus paracasei]MED7652348.1 LysM peptidoglycan-binding domain-containing protein [Lacticaseibacillus paracasei]PTS46796.1 LysM peptidoglycan-binding domain-containing protein [Lactobacillus sp. DS1_6]PTS54035.1 LysM peptidoglycan-binding domain-containing protein [Lactobacillus sp. DS2_6]PTV40784.1 LysM peptidoglycan-binding domain-containing protein [Lactobacillus sp. DS13_6]